VIGHAIESAMSQTDPDLEILAVCDGCDASTLDALRSFDDARMRVFELPKSPGFGWANRNIALREARGDLVAFLGDDDLWLPDHLEKLDGAFTDEAVEWAYSRPLFLRDDGVLVPGAVDLRRPDHLDRFLTVGNSIPAACVVHRRSALDRYGYWPDDLWKGETAPVIDWELWKRMIGPSGGANAAYVPEPTTIHFRAAWRNSAGWGIPGWDDGSQQAQDDWWPPGLRVDLSGSDMPQAAVWRSLQADPGWARQMRAAVEMLFDGFPWRWASERRRSAALEAAVAEATGHITALTAELAARDLALAERDLALAERDAALQEERRSNHALVSSTSWKLTSPARSVGARFRSAIQRGRPH
jgi:hypothetical protein